MLLIEKATKKADTCKKQMEMRGEKKKKKPKNGLLKCLSKKSRKREACGRRVGQGERKWSQYER